jgi:hypothetical protein
MRSQYWRCYPDFYLSNSGLSGQRRARISERLTIQPNITLAKMFFDEIQPILKEFSKEPIAFLGGFFSGVFHLNLADDPVKSWLDERAGATAGSALDSNQNGNGNKPQSITIE